jgi:hypothetical protein
LDFLDFDVEQLNLFGQNNSKFKELKAYLFLSHLLGEKTFGAKIVRKKVNRVGFFSLSKLVYMGKKSAILS